MYTYMGFHFVSSKLLTDFGPCIRMKVLNHTIEYWQDNFLLKACSFAKDLIVNTRPL
jgi:hypothetical protein